MQSPVKRIRTAHIRRQSVLLSSSLTTISRYWITFHLLNGSTLFHQSQKLHEPSKGNTIPNRRNRASGVRGRVFPPVFIADSLCEASSTFPSLSFTICETSIALAACGQSGNMRGSKEHSSTLS